MFPALEQSSFLGPATVIRVEDGRVLLSLPQTQAWATMALAFPYVPQPGDTLLAIAQDEDYYIIGVLQGNGPTTLTNADFSYAHLESANFANADLTGANLHGILDKHAKWDRATLKNVKKTDPDRLHAETWTPPA